MSSLPPDPLPALPDPAYEGELGPYSVSRLRDVCGTRTNPDSFLYYRRRDVMKKKVCIKKQCAHPLLEPWIATVGGYDPRCSVVQPPAEEWPLSSVMARIDGRVRGRLPFDPPEMSYFVDYSSFHSNPKELPSGEGVEKMKERIFPEKSELILTFYNDKALKMSLWKHGRNFFKAPFLDQFTAILMPDFSAYCNDPIPQYLIGERQIQIFASEGTEEGHTIIPTIVWASRESLRRQTEFWLAQYPRVHTIRIDCYGHNVDRVGWAWRHLFAMEKYMQGHDHIHWIITGMTSGWMIRELNRIFPKKNYSLVAPVNTFVSSLRGSTDRKWSAYQFRKKIAQLEDLRSGREVADAQPRPKSWPTYPEIDIAGFREPLPHERDQAKKT